MRTAFRVVVAALLIGCTEQTGPAPIPARPTDLQVTLTSANTAHLTWKSGAPDDATLTYNVYRDGIKVGTATATEYTDAGLPGNATHTWFVTSRNSKGGVSAPSDPAVLFLGDNSAPTVTATSPSNGAAGISRIAAASVTFSEPMIPGTVNPTTVVATITATGTIVYGTVNYDAASRTADFWPLSFLPAATGITITVGTGVRDLGGNGLASAFSFSFTTGNTPASAVELPPNAETILIAQNAAPNGGPPLGVEIPGGSEIFKMRSDGSGKVNLSNHPSGEFDGAWSPDGRHVAFSSGRNGNLDIFIMRDDGKGVRQLTSDVADESQPRWSPDAQRIVYRSRKDGSPPGPGFFPTTDIFSMNADGTGQLNLTKTPDVFDYWPSWSPDGKRLLFTCQGVAGPNANGEIVLSSPRFIVANADGSSPVPLRAPDPNFTDDVAGWSPDGSQIAFSAINVKQPRFFMNVFTALFVIGADGTGLRQLTNGGSQRFPSWSSDGTELVYSTSDFNESWGRFGQIDVRKSSVAGGPETVLADFDPTSQVMSPQAWRR